MVACALLRNHVDLLRALLFTGTKFPSFKGARKSQKDGYLKLPGGTYLSLNSL